MGRRREQRVEMNIVVKVWGLDRHGKPFVQHARTVDASRVGAQLLGVNCVKLGDTVGIQNGEHKARFKVIWIGRENTPKAGLVGVHCLEPEKEIFGPDSARGGSEPDFFNAGAREAGFEPRKRPARRDMPSSRRRHPRYPCAGGVELLQHEGAQPLWGNLSDLSLTGCYVETTSTLPAGNMVLFHIRTHDLEIRGRAVIKTSHHAVGMGLAFLHLAPEDQHNLEFLIGTLAGIQEMRPEERQTFVPADPPEPPPARTAPEPELQAMQMAAPLADGTISGQIMQSIGNLTQLEQHLVTEHVDPRLIAQFHDAMEHIRQTAWTVHQWVDLNGSGGDPFMVLPQLEAERMHMLTKLAHNVLADIDSGGAQEIGEGVQQLYETIAKLHSRLKQMFNDGPEEEDDTGTFRARR